MIGPVAMDTGLAFEGQCCCSDLEGVTNYLCLKIKRFL